MMPLYWWKGITRSGSIRMGLQVALDPDALRQTLIERPMGLLRYKRIPFVVLYSVSAKDKILVFQQLGLLLDSGLTLLQAIDVLVIQVHRYGIALQLETVGLQLRQGLDISNALSRAKKLFDRQARELLATSLHSGTQAQVCHLLAKNQERRTNFIQAVIGSLSGPVGTAVLGLCILVFLIIFIMPSYAELFESLDSQLPASTQWLLSATASFSDPHSQLLSIAVTVLCVLVGVWFRRTYPGVVQRMVRLVPFIGAVQELNQLSTYFLCLGNLLQAGVGLTEALTIAQTCVTNDYLIIVCNELQQQVQDGVSLAQAMRKAFAGTSRGVHIASIVQASVKSGVIGQGFLQIASMLQHEALDSLKRFTRVVGPAALLLVGAFVCVVCLALYQPLLELPDVMQNI